MSVTLKKLSDQVIVITGATSGIGLETARRAAARGAKVVLASRNEAVLTRVENEIRAAGGEAIHVVTDVSKREDIEALAAHVIATYGSFDTWVNNAGLGIFGKLEEVSEEDNRRLFDVNFWGLVNGTIIAASHLRKTGGAIINLGSVASDIGFPMQGMYCASKHAIKGFTDAFRMELQDDGAPISVTLIKPTAIDTPFTIHARNYTGKRPNLPPPVYAPEDVADAILHAAENGGRDYYVGGAGKLMTSFNKVAPRVVDAFGAHMITKQSTRNEPENRDPMGNLYNAGEDGQVHGDTNHLVMRSAYTKATMHPLATSAIVAGIGLTIAAVLGRNDKS